MPDTSGPTRADQTAPPLPAGFDAIVGDERIMAILRGHPPTAAVDLANRLWDAGIGLVEVPIGTPEALAALAAAGAAYTVAPGFDPIVLAASLTAGLPHLPGVATPTEAQHARAAGARVVALGSALTDPDEVRRIVAAGRRGPR